MCLPEGDRHSSEITMALEAMVYPQQTQDPFGSAIIKDYFYNHNLLTGSGNWGYEDLNFVKEEHEQQSQGGSSISLSTFHQQNQTQHYPNYGDWNISSPPIMLPPHNNLSNSNPSSETTELSNNHNLDCSTSTPSRPKRRRAKTRKNKEEIENQRMTHIAVERNRRKQMNEYLSVLRSLMPDSYVQRGDQASIIGGAINFVKELEQRLQFLGAHEKESEGKSEEAACGGADNMPFSEFFAFPQYSTSSAAGGSENSVAIGENNTMQGEVHCGSIADVEVTMVESHANLKIRSKKRPKQLLKMVSGLHSMRLTILHLNVTTTGEVVLYSLSVKVEDDCKLGSVDDIAAAVYHLLERIQQEAMLS